jgi:hypothetical protein
MLVMVLNGDHYLQINGTAMGTKMAPSYANTYIYKMMVVGPFKQNYLFDLDITVISFLYMTLCRVQK